MELICPLVFQNRPIKILIIGAGGNGSCLLREIYKLHCKFTETEHQYGFDITVADGSDVTPTNVLRQAFWANDIGSNKATLQVSRYNIFGYRVNWKSIPNHLDAVEIINKMKNFDILITCVDSAQLRCEINQVAKKFSDSIRGKFWMDLGNEANSGNIFLSHLAVTSQKCVPSVVELNPSMHAIIDNPKRSCSAVETFSEQDVLTNQFCASIAANMLRQFFTSPSLDHHAIYFDLSKGISIKSLPLDSEIIKRMFGYQHIEDNQLSGNEHVGR